MSQYLSHIMLDSIINLRTFNHLKTRDNAKLKPNRLYRSATFDFATEEDIEVVDGLKIDLFVDFRSENEKEPLKSEKFDKRFHRVAKTIDVMNFFSEQKVADLQTKSLVQMQDLFVTLYRAFPSQYQAVFKDVFTYLESGKRIAYHCSAGKDRTGIMSYLILSALNVAEDDIMENFLESNLYSKQLVEQFKSHVKGMDLDLYEQMQLVLPEYLASAIKTINTEYGGIERYLCSTLHVDVDQIRNHYLD